MSVPVFWAGVVSRRGGVAFVPLRGAAKLARLGARAGMVLAFAVAFYAAMYGFPVTIYLLTNEQRAAHAQHGLGRVPNRERAHGAALCAGSRASIRRLTRRRR